VDFDNGVLTCALKTDVPKATCPGNFELNCIADDVGSDFNEEKNCQVFYAS
jgi:hypothetical protein